jgi:D-arabinonate dehydratase
MKIESIETIALRALLKRVFRGSHYQMTHRCTIITRVRTTDGVVGEAYNGDEDQSQADIQRIVENELGPLLLGKSIFNVEGCWETMLPLTFDILRDRGAVLKAMACLDSAIWDAIGKTLGQPLVNLWGGYHQALPIVAIGGYYGLSLAEIGQEMEDYLKLGLAGCKFKVGGRSPEEDAERTRAAREAGGPDFVLMVDANGGYTVEEAVRFCRLTADLNLRWFEEPCRWQNDRRAMRDVRYLTGLPVCAGQSERSRTGARDLMVDGAIDVCNFDASWVGGPTEWRRVAGMAAAFGVEMGHHEEPQLSAHLLGAIPHGTYVECFHPDRDPLFWELIANRPEACNGSYEIPAGPGWGLVLDETCIRRYRV